MNILIISLAYPPFVGGAELAVKEITDRMPHHRFDLITVNLDGKQQNVETIGRVRVHRLGKGFFSKYAFPWTAFRKAEMLLRENHYDIVWGIMANQAGLAAAHVKKKHPELQFVLTLQEGDSLLRIWSRTLLIRTFYKTMYRRADVIQAISTFLARRAEKMGAKNKIVVVPNGVDLSVFQRQYDPAELQKLKASLGIEGPVVVTSSRLVYKNGIDTLIRAIKLVPATLLILGTGNQEAKLRSLAKEIDVASKVVFGGYVSHADLPKYLKIADVFARPSRSEGLGSSFLEAMAAGLPIVGTRVGGIPDFLTHGETGLFCEVNNPKDCADKIELLLTDRTLAQQLANNGMVLVAEGYDWNSVAGKIEEVFK